MNEKYRDICEQLGWRITDDSYGHIELEKYSPAGEDFSFIVCAKSFVENVKEYAESFDQDEHIEMWIEARHNGVRGVPSTRELVKDAEEIESMLKELSEALLETELQRESIRRTAHV